MAGEQLVPRRASRAVAAALADTRVVVISGARQAGKSTLAQLALDQHPGGRLRFLDDEGDRTTAEADPSAFVRHPGLLVIDEVQRVPGLMLQIKYEVDTDPRPGRFLLTGSAKLFGLQAIPDLLPGRTETIELWPLSQGEIDRTADAFVDAVFQSVDLLALPATTDRMSDYVARALRGGYPEALRREDLGRRTRFFDAYISDLIRKDVAQLTEIERPRDMRRLLNVAAAQMATLLVPNQWASALDLPGTTVKRYLRLLDLIFLIREIPAWSTNLTRRAVHTPKLLFCDSGLAGHLAGLTPRRAEHPSAPVGQLIENFVIGELARQLSWAEEPVRLYHYRDRDGYEVDALLERASGEIVAIEVKAAETVRSDDFRGIDAFARRVGDLMIHGIVLYAGRQPLSFGNRRVALPISSLWSSALG